MSSPFELADDLGPAKVIHVQNPSLGLRGILVVDNLAVGPAIGGLRMAPDVSLEECARLARAMTLKNAAAGLRHGGGKSVLFGDPRMAKPEKEKLVRGFATALAGESGYIFGPDMGTNEECMAWVKDEIGRAVGLPREIGGIPLDEIGATGWGLSQAIEAALPQAGFDLQGARVAVQGFGAVGRHSARFLAEQGAKLVAASDSRGTITDPEGLDLTRLEALKAEGRSVVDYGETGRGEAAAIIDVDCDIWIPAARPDVVTGENVRRLKTRLVAQGANIPFSEEAELYLHQNGVLCLPDFIANAGGVICAAMEYAGAGERAALEAIAERIRFNTKAMLDRARADDSTPRAAAVALSLERLRKAMSYRRWSIY